ncbi:unnamed protein product [Protopolystoma xenopodis]|uniref:Uncharacterized protein n=1 Tax=Protopolystoma xenopodis TaxID=117903 RepID=A0A448X4V8_9PLAT|nr:unnamed protein product [Protopolystoma xenopodis]
MPKSYKLLPELGRQQIPCLLSPHPSGPRSLSLWGADLTAVTMVKKSPSRLAGRVGGAELVRRRAGLFRRRTGLTARDSSSLTWQLIATNQ